MEADLYEALIGGGAGDKGKVIAAALRRRNEMGQLGMLTGDKVLSSVGKGLASSSDEYAEQLQKIRSKGIDDAQTEKYQTGQLDHMGNTLAETKRNNDLLHQYHMAMAEAAGVRADKAGTGGKIPKLRQGDIKDLQDMSQTIGAIDSLQSYLDEGGRFGAKEIAGKPIPGFRLLTNTLAAKGIGTEDDLKAFAKKQEWSRMYDLAERNRLFGATLTPNEQTSWKQANPSTEMTDKQIREALPVMRKVFKHRMDSKVGGLTKEGYSGEAMADYADIPGVNTPMAPDAGAQAPAGNGKRIKVDAEGNIIP